MTPANYTTWVLGAGFSRSLGGPLLADFFSAGLDLQIASIARRRTFKNLGGEEIQLLNGVYGRAQEVSRPWRDPEQFIAMLDAGAQAPEGRAGQLIHDIGVDPKRLWLAANSYVAIATEMFCPATLEELHRSESWAPYVRWAKRVAAAGDVVITFNYDRVVELASGYKIDAAMPLANFQQTHRPWLLKLHGSVTWRTEDGEPRSHTSPPLDRIADGDQVFLGLPGRTKYENTARGLSPLWTVGMDELRRASRIVFVGYRFPPGDSEALRQLLDAIAGNTRSDLQIDVVLGPNIHSPDVIRLQRLLEWALVGKGKRDREAARHRVQVEPLFAEDFLALYDF